ncbi:unnamed protein product [Chrysodeixis includens]|uniref:GST N-terminal domain-containing protein n=1 Tax=Chrysodeixis includens TaxID=689277 RepID=A0A9N8KZV9_CHRIL|nr:unnamed protein product [Chrysodeixis includens]
MVLTLYKMDASPPVRAVYMVIEYLGIPDVNYVELNLLADEHLKDNFLKLNPQHTIPHLTDGNFNIWDRYPNITGWLKRCSEHEFYKKGNLPGLLEFRRLLKEYLSR